MSERPTPAYLIARCHKCRQVWAMDYQPEPCHGCGDTAGSSFVEVVADDFRAAVRMVNDMIELAEAEAEPSERVVWKYAANPSGVYRIPWDSDVVLFDYDPKSGSPWPHVWAETSPEHGPRTRNLLIHGTGHPVDGIWQASCVDRKTGLVWHLYDITTGRDARDKVQ